MSSKELREFFSRYLLDEEFRTRADGSIDDVLSEYNFDAEINETIRTRSSKLVDLVYSTQLEIPKLSELRDDEDDSFERILKVGMVRIMIVKVKDPTKVTVTKMALVPSSIDGEFNKTSVYFSAVLPDLPDDSSDDVRRAAQHVKDSNATDRYEKLLGFMTAIVDDI